MLDNVKLATQAVQDAADLNELIYAFNVAIGRATPGLKGFALSVESPRDQSDLLLGTYNDENYLIHKTLVAPLQKLIRTGFCQYAFSASGSAHVGRVYFVLKDGRIGMMDRLYGDKLAVPEDQADMQKTIERLISQKKATRATAIYGVLPDYREESPKKKAARELQALFDANREDIDPSLSDDELSTLFSSVVQTPIGAVMFGKNQQAKMDDKGRTNYAGWIRPTLTDPLMIIQDKSAARDGSGERDFSNVFVKAVGVPGGKGYGFVCVSVQIATHEVVISNHMKNIRQLVNLMEKGRVIYRKDKTAKMMESWIEGSNRNAPPVLCTDRSAVCALGTSAPLGTLNITGFLDGLNELSLVSWADLFEEARQAVNIEPTLAQQESGNYAKGHITWRGLPLAIENPRGSVRRGVDEAGQEWETVMPFDYGYIKRTQGADDDHIDCFVGTEYEQDAVFIVNQVNPRTGAFDEHKVMLAFGDKQAAHDAYLASYEAGWNGLESIHELTMDEFKAWMATDAREPYSAPHAMMESVDVIEPKDLIFGGVDFVPMSAAEFDHGRVSYVTTVKGQEVRTAFRLVEASSLVVSNSLDGRINAGYPQELQPRDRTRAASVLQIARLSKSLRPVQLADSGLSSHGAPIIGPDLAVESGNGRTMAIIKAYAEGNANEYRQYLIDNADLYGFTEDEVTRLNQPVLVRARLDDVDRVQFAKDSNVSDLQSMSPVEQARVDAEAIDERMLALFNPGDSGDLLAASNRPFIQAFLGGLASEQAAGLMTADGRPTKQVIDRVQAAIFAKAYQNDQLLTLAVEEPDPEIRNILTALNTAAPEFIQMRYLSGEAHKQATDAMASGAMLTKTLDEQALNALVDATAVVRDAKAAGQDIDEYLSQKGLFGDVDPHAAALAKFIAMNNRSSKRMGEAFKAMAAEINAELAHQGAAASDMFGAEPMDLFTVLARVSERLTEQYGEKGAIQTSMFESAGWLKQSTLAQAVRVIKGAHSLQGVLGLLDYVTASSEQKRMSDMIGKLLCGPILELQQAKTADQTAAAATLYVDALGAIPSNGLSPLGVTLKEAERAEWYPGAKGFTPGWTYHLRLYASIKEAILAARELKAQGGNDLERQLKVLYEKISFISITPSVLNCLSWLMGENYDANDFALEFCSIDTTEFMRVKDRYQQQIRDIGIKHTSGGREWFLDNLEEVLSPEQMRGWLVKDGDRRLAEAMPATAIKGLSTKIIKAMSAYRSGKKSLYDCLFDAAKSWVNSTPNGVGGLAYNELVEAANRILNKSYEASWNALQIKGAGAAEVVSMVNTFIDSGLTMDERSHLVKQTPVKIKSGRLAGGYTLQDMRNDLGNFYSLAAGQLVAPSIVYEKKRAHASRNGTLNSGASLDKGTLWHELGHMVEYKNHDLFMLAKNLLVRRLQAIPEGSAQYLPLRDLTGISSYGDDEIALNDGFYDPYAGKMCHGNTPGDVISTEVWSTGFQCLATPSGIIMLGSRDPEHMALIMAGMDLLKKKKQSEVN